MVREKKVIKEDFMRTFGKDWNAGDEAVEAFLANRTHENIVAVVPHYIGLVGEAANELGQLIPIEDLEGVGKYALIDALQRFDPKKHQTRFSTYVTHVIRGKMKNYVRDSREMIRSPHHILENLPAYNKALDSLMHSLGRKPTIEEIAYTIKIEIKDRNGKKFTPVERERLKITLVKHLSDHVEQPREVQSIHRDGIASSSSEDERDEWGLAMGRSSFWCKQDGNSWEIEEPLEERLLNMITNGLGFEPKSTSAIQQKLKCDYETARTVLREYNRLKEVVSI